MRRLRAQRKASQQSRWRARLIAKAQPAHWERPAAPGSSEVVVLPRDPDRPEGDVDADAVVLGPSEAILLSLA